MSKATNYRGTEIKQTNTTTSTGGNRVAYVYELTGAVTKSAMVRPFITSQKQAREYIATVLDSGN